MRYIKLYNVVRNCIMTQSINDEIIPIMASGRGRVIHKCVQCGTKLYYNIIPIMTSERGLVIHIVLQWGTSAAIDN